MDSNKIKIELTAHELEVICMALYKTKKHGQFPKWVNLKTNDEVDGKELLERLINLLAKARGEGGDYEIQVEK